MKIERTNDSTVFGSKTGIDDSFEMFITVKSTKLEFAKLKEIRYYASDFITGLQFIWGDDELMRSPEYTSSTSAMITSSVKFTPEHISVVKLGWASDAEDNEKLNLVSL